MSSYIYTPLQPSQIRLLTLLPGSFEDPLAGYLNIAPFAANRYPVYEALSYVWGDQSHPERISLLQEDLAGENIVGENVQSLAIGPSLASALHQFRHEHESRSLWCDSICINQDDLAERSAQVLLMGDLYREASRVVVWLGREEENSSQAIEVMNYSASQVEFNKITGQIDLIPTADKAYRSWDGRIPYTPEQWLAVQRLLERDWFNRLWTRQEITLAKRHRALVVVGPTTISWSRFICAVGYVFVKYSNSPSIQRSIDFARKISSIWNFGRTEPNTRGLLTLIEYSKSCECTDNRDRLYALLGLLHPEQRLDLDFAPNYKLSVKDVYKLFAKYYAKKGVVNLLAYCNMATTPSWVPDLHTLPRFRLGDYTSEAPAVVGSIDVIDEDKVGVSGILHGTIAQSKAVQEDCSDAQFKRSVLEIMIDYLGYDSKNWKLSRGDNFTEAVLGGLTFEYRNDNEYLSLPVAISILQEWDKSEVGHGEEDDLLNESSPNEILLVQALRRVLGGRACLQLMDGSFAVGPRGSQSGDLVYVVLGCGIPLVLRGKLESSFRIIGPSYYPGCAGADDILGPLPNGWKLGFDNFGRLLFKDEHGSKHWKDPRKQEINLPLGWLEYEDKDGRPYWWKQGSGEPSTYKDPRLTAELLKGQGIKVESLVLI
jgi:hypothetical protein